MASDLTMALTEPEHVKARMKDLRKRAGETQQDVANAIGEPYRTFQSWENAEVETDRANYDKVARHYTRKLKHKVTTDWILFGQDQAPPLTASTPDVMGSLNGDRDLGDELQGARQQIGALQEQLSEQGAALTDLEEIIRGQLVPLIARVNGVMDERRLGEIAATPPKRAPRRSRQAS